MFPYNSNPYTEGQWVPNTMASVPGFDYDSGSNYTNSTSQQHGASHESQPPRESAAAVTSGATPLVDDTRSRASPDAYNDNSSIASYSQHQSQQQEHPQHHHHHHHHHAQSTHFHNPHQEEAARYAMGAYSYPSTSLPLSPPTSTTAYLGQDMSSGLGAGSQALNRTSPISTTAQILDGTKRKRTDSQSDRTPELTDEEKLLLKLKEEENLPWKDIALRFQQDMGKTYQVPALQMRFKRLRERIRTWSETDIQALEQAYEYWEKYQFEIVAAKMVDFGCTERFPSKAVQRKWEELHGGQPPAQQSDRQSFQFAGPDSTSTFYPYSKYYGSHDFLPPQHGFVRNLSVGTSFTTSAAAFTAPRHADEQFVFGQQPGSRSILSPPPISIPGSAAVSVFGASPRVQSTSTKFPSVTGHSIHNPRSSSIPTPRSAGGTSPCSYSTSDDTSTTAATATAAASTVGAGTTSITEVGGVHMGLGLHLGTRNISNDDTARLFKRPRQRSFSEMP